MSEIVVEHWPSASRRQWRGSSAYGLGTGSPTDVAGGRDQRGALGNQMRQRHGRVGDMESSLPPPAWVSELSHGPAERLALRRVAPLVASPVLKRTAARRMRQ